MRGRDGALLAGLVHPKARPEAAHHGLGKGLGGWERARVGHQDARAGGEAQVGFQDEVARVLVLPMRLEHDRLDRHLARRPRGLRLGRRGLAAAAARAVDGAPDEGRHQGARGLVPRASDILHEEVLRRPHDLRAGGVAVKAAVEAAGTLELDVKVRPARELVLDHLVRAPPPRREARVRRAKVGDVRRHVTLRVGAHLGTVLW